jgi:hypothetical protein
MKQNIFSSIEIGKLSIIKNTEPKKEKKNMNEINFSSRYKKSSGNPKPKKDYRTRQNSPIKNNKVPKIKNISNNRIKTDNLQMDEGSKYSSQTYDINNIGKKENPKIENEKNITKENNDEDKFMLLEKKMEKKYKDLSKIIEEKFNNMNKFFEEKYKIINNNFNEVIKYNKQLDEKFDNLKNENIKKLEENQNQINQLNDQIIKSKDKLKEYKNIIQQSEKKEEKYQKIIEKLKAENKKLKEEKNKKEMEKNNNNIINNNDIMKQDKDFQFNKYNSVNTNLVLNLPNFKGQKSIHKKENKLIALKKIKNSPFINSILQCFIQIESLTNYFKNDQCINIFNHHELASAFKELVLQLSDKNNRSLDCQNLLNTAIEINNSKIDDTYELDNIYGFLKFILKQLHEELKIDINPNNNFEINNKLKLNKFELKSFKEEIKQISIITDLFQGINEKIIYCLSQNIQNINNSIYKFHPFLYLSIELKNINFEKNEITIFEFLRNMRQEQTFSKEQYCEFCDKKCFMSGKSKILICPKILIVMLKYGNNYVKINFEETLDITIFTKLENENNVDMKKYNLSGVITMMGNNFENKYIAYCKNDFDENWYRYHDEDIKLIYNVRNEIIGHEMPLILFYKMS